jgi:thiol:disulfide interchange protein
MHVPPLLDWVVQQFQASPVPTVVVGLVVLAVALWILRQSIKILLVLIGLAVLAVLASYFFRGEEETNKVLKDLGRKVTKQEQPADAPGPDGGQR